MHLRFGASLCIGTIITMSPNFVVFDIRLFRRGGNGMTGCSEKIFFTISSDISIRESIQSNITQFVNASTPTGHEVHRALHAQNILKEVKTYSEHNES